MHNIKLTLEYDGSRYQGWQRAAGESTNTVSNKLLEVIHKMTAEDVELYCGARTEVGVHAYEQTVSFKTTSDMKPCLLYTSPSPRDRSLSRMPSSA